MPNCPDAHLNLLADADALAVLHMCTQNGLQQLAFLLLQAPSCFPPVVPARITGAVVPLAATHTSVQNDTFPKKEQPEMKISGYEESTEQDSLSLVPPHCVKYKTVQKYLAPCLGMGLYLHLTVQPVLLLQQ